MLDALRTRFAVVLFIAALVLEEILVTGRTNTHRGAGQEAGAWAVRLPLHHNHWAAFLSWLVVILVAIAFVRFAAQGRLIWTIAIIGAAVLFELLHGHDLPNPQNDPVVVIAWLLGVLQVLYEILTTEDIRDRLRDGLRHLGFA